MILSRKKSQNVCFLFLVESRFGIFHALMLSFLDIISGQLIFLTYGSTITKNSGTHISPKISSISMAVVQLLAVSISILFIDRKGRRFLLTLSMFGCALSHGLIAVFLYFHNNNFDTAMFNWLPIFGMSSVIFSASIGIVPLYVICVAENFPTKTRSFGMALSSTLLNVLLFVAIKMYPILENYLGLQTCFMIFCMSCAFGVFYSAFYLKETMGKELNITNQRN